MSDRIKAELDSQFARRDESKATAAQERAARQLQEQDFVTQFAAVRDKTIRPVLEQFKAELAQRGHGAEFTVGSMPDGEVIAIEFGLRGAGGFPPAFKFSGTKHDQMVVLTQTGAGHRQKPMGSLRLTAITSDLVEQKVLDLLRQVLK